MFSINQSFFISWLQTTTTTTITAPTTIEKISTTLTEAGGKNRQNAESNVNDEITTVNDDFETATELLNEGSAACPSCTCECGATDLSSSEMATNFKAPNAKAEEKFVDLLDIYNQNQSDLDNGIFNDGMLFAILRDRISWPRNIWPQNNWLRNIWPPIVDFDPLFKWPTNAKAEEKFVDLLEIYNWNQSDLDNGIFNDGMLRKILGGMLDLTLIYKMVDFFWPPFQMAPNAKAEEKFVDLLDIHN